MLAYGLRSRAMYKRAHEAVDAEEIPDPKTSCLEIEQGRQGQDRLG